MRALIFYMGLIAMIAWGIHEVRESLPIVRMEMGILDNRKMDLEKTLKLTD